MTRNRTRAGRERTSRSPTAGRGPGRRSSRSRLRKAAGLPARDDTTGIKAAAPAPETDDPLPVEEPSAVLAGGEPRPTAEPREAAEVVPDSLCFLTAPVGPDAGEPGKAGTVADPPPAVVVATGLDDGVVTETVATGVVALTVVVGTDGTTLGTVVDTVGTVVDTVGTVVDTVGTRVDTVETTVDTGGTVVGTVVGTVGTVTVALSGRAVASTFATKKPDTAKQTSTTSVLHFTIFISPSETACTQQELLAPPASLVTSELSAR
jgi:hypothetical protein